MSHKLSVVSYQWIVGSPKINEVQVWYPEVAFSDAGF